MKIFVANSAYRDLEDIKEYYKDGAIPHVEERFVTEIIEHTQTLADNPEIGRVVPEFGEEQIRELIHSPFRVVYLREFDSIHIIRVWRSERMLKLSDESET